MNKAKVYFFDFYLYLFYFRHWTVVRVRLFSDINHVITKADEN